MPARARSLFFIILCILPASAIAEIVLDGAWIRNLPPTIPMRAGYLNISNQSGQAERLISLHSPVFEKVEIHRSFEQDGVSKMEMLPALSIPAGNNLRLQPGGIHLMLIQPLLDIRVGDQVELCLEFEHAGKKCINMELRK